MNVFHWYNEYAHFWLSYSFIGTCWGKNEPRLDNEVTCISFPTVWAMTQIYKHRVLKCLWASLSYQTLKTWSDVLEHERANHIHRGYQRCIFLHVLDTKVGECVLRIKTNAEDGCNGLKIPLEADIHAFQRQNQLHNKGAKINMVCGTKKETYHITNMLDGCSGICWQKKILLQ